VNVRRLAAVVMSLAIAPSIAAADGDATPGASALHATATASGVRESASGAPFTPDDLLLYEVLWRGGTLSDALTTYSSRAGLYLPLGELARLLDLAIAVDPPARRAEGWLLAPGRRFELDLDGRFAVADGRRVALRADDAVLLDGELYVRVDVLERLWPVRLAADASALTLTVGTREPFPFEQRLDRDRRRAGLHPAADAGTGARRIAVPYALATPPSLDVDVSIGVDRGQVERPYELRLANDLAYAGLQVYAGADRRGDLSEVRVQLERRDADGQALGALGATRAALGDVYTPSLALGPRSHGGRGFAITSEPLERASVFDRIDLRGELPAGWDVELYVNEVLRAATAAAPQGRYEFTDVPLVYGANVVRLAFYGPRGERREEVRRIDVGSGQLAEGQTVASLGVVEQGRALIEPRARALDGAPAADRGTGTLQAALSVAHGFAAGLTAGVGLAQYAPTDGIERAVAAVNVAGSIGVLALRADAARDDAGGTGATLAIAGRPGGASVVARHAEYRGGFVDELQSGSPPGSTPLSRSTDVRADLIARPFAGGAAVPVSLRAQRDEHVDGRTLYTAGARMSSVAGRLLLASGVDVERSDRPDGGAERRVLGSFDGSGALGGGWQLRGGASYEVQPDLRLRSLGMTLDGRLSRRTALRVGVEHAFDYAAATYVHGGLTWRLAACDLSLSAGYGLRSGDAQALLRFSFGTLFDPTRGRYAVSRPGVATGGALALRAFTDADGDGRWSAAETAVAGVVVDASSGAVATDRAGRALVGEFGDAARARIGVRAESIEDPYLSLPASVLEFQPRAGRVVTADLPLSPTGEVQVRVLLDEGAGAARGLSAVQVELWRDGERRAAGRTEFDGTVVIDGLRPGRYELRLDADMAARLRLRLADTPTLTIPAHGGYAGVVLARVAFDRAL
jgi:hypothetical protein